AAATPSGAESPDLKTAFFLPETVIGEQRADDRRGGPGPSPHRPAPPPRSEPQPPVHITDRPGIQAPADGGAPGDHPERHARSVRTGGEREARRARHEEEADRDRDAGREADVARRTEAGRDRAERREHRGEHRSGQKRRRRDREGDTAILDHPHRPEDFLSENGRAFGRPRATPPSPADPRRLTIR